MQNVKILDRLILLCITGLLFSCSVTPPKQLTLEQRPALASSHIVIDMSDAVFRFKSYIDSPAEGIGRKVGRNVLGACVQNGGGGELGAAVSALWFVLCTPFATVAGVADGANDVVSEDELQELGKGWFQSALPQVVSEKLEHDFNAYLGAVDLNIPVRVSREQVLPQEGSPTVKISQFLLQAEILDEKTQPLHLLLSFHVAVTDRGGQMTDEFTLERKVIFNASDQWLSGDHLKLEKDISTFLQISVERVVNEVFLVYVPQKGGFDCGMVPCFSLQPINPPFRRKLYFQNPTWNGQEIFPLNMTAPLFEWEALPRMFSGREETLSDLVYDFRIYSGWEVFYEQFDLTEPRHQPAVSLKPCGFYRWTVRARFRLYGAPRATEWLGGYSTLGGQVGPWWVRRNSKPALVLSPDNLWYYPMIIAPGAGNISCLE